MFALLENLWNLPQNEYDITISPWKIKVTDSYREFKGWNILRHSVGAIFENLYSVARHKM